ncbi:CLUMA_CG007396, isoform A [Clunio marinus]|uniref:CLUMA_CG007396, isoform A n=1 Tax=Clunio marinus TaxID=568069 RepID=A0A1J1I0R9_9DIPT|nr:CLUMA_CG007396, isoform A [Clunio marinus]
MTRYWLETCPSGFQTSKMFKHLIPQRYPPTSTILVSMTSCLRLEWPPQQNKTIRIDGEINFNSEMSFLITFQLHCGSSFRLKYVIVEALIENTDREVFLFDEWFRDHKTRDNRYSFLVIN